VVKEKVVKGKGKKEKKKVVEEVAAELIPSKPATVTPLVQHNATFITPAPTAASSFEEIRAIKVVTSSRQSRKAAAAVAATSSEATEPEANPTGTATPGLHAGRIVSGRWWKAEHKSRTSNLQTSKRKGKSRYDKRKQAETKMKDLKSFNAEMIVESSARKQAEREKLEKRQQLRVDNERKSEIVQMVTNTAKLKKLNRKQLRQYEKR